jgi:hypothetical protein
MTGFAGEVDGGRGVHRFDADVAFGGFAAGGLGLGDRGEEKE